MAILGQKLVQGKISFPFRVGNGYERISVPSV